MINSSNANNGGRLSISAPEHSILVKAKLTAKACRPSPYNIRLLRAIANYATL